MIDTIPMTEVPCALCGTLEAEPAYARVHETGSVLGRLSARLVLCSQCGFLYTNPRPTPAVLGEYYREATVASGRTFRRSEAGSSHGRLLEDRAAFLKAQLERFAPASTEPLRLLDVGCGRGGFLNAMAGQELVLCGLEPSAEAARVARASGIAVTEERLEKTTLEAGGFGVVACISTLEHAFDPAAFLEALGRLVQTAGLLFLEVPDSTRPVAQVAEFFSFEHLSHFTAATLELALARAGFAMLATERCARTSALRCLARHVPSGALPRTPATSGGRELREALSIYRAERHALEAELLARITPRVEAWRAEGARVAIYGAGVHTRFLLDLVDFGESLVVVLDSDPSKAGSSFLRWTVQAPTALEELRIDAIVVSSKAYQGEILTALAQPAEQLGIEVLGCYGEEAA